MKTKEEWLDEMELRLKRAFLDVADLSEEEGQRFLTEEIESHLEDVAGEGNRKEYLLSLRERFPLLLNQNSKLSETALREIMQASGEENESSVSTEAAMDRVRRDWDSIPEAAQRAFLADCNAVPLSGSEAASGTSQQTAPESDVTVRDPGTASGKPARTAPEPVRTDTYEESSDEFTRFLKLEQEAPLSSERLQEIFIGLLKTVSQVDALGTQVYKQLQLSREISQRDLRKLVGNYVTGSTMDAAELNRMLDESRIKVGLIISTIANLPSVLSQTHLAKFQPALIEQMAGTGGFLGAKETKCWKKYLSIAGDLEPQQIEKAINDLMISQLKKLKRS